MAKNNEKLESLKEIANKIIQSSHNEKLEILISVRAFLFDNAEINGIVFDDDCNFDLILEQSKTKSNAFIKNQNEINIKKLGIKSQDIYFLPKNKKNSLIDLVDSLVEEYNTIVIFDKVRADPFLQDELFNFIIENKNYFSTDNFDLFQKRAEEKNKIITYANIEKSIYETCIIESRKNKIKNYWINIWGLSESYLNPGIIENLLL